MIDYLPYFMDNKGNRWDVLSMDWCVDFGGRQCQIECQRNNGDGQYPIKTFVICGLDGDFCQWGHEVDNVIPEKSTFYDAVMGMFKVFGENQ